jgi:hypothetical protein
MKMRKEEMPIAMKLPVATFRVADWDENAVAFVTLQAGVDATPLLKGLKGDMCQCPHWGYILSGAIHVKYADGKEELCQAGDVFYWPEGHTVWVTEDTSFIEFSPRRELHKVYDHIEKQLAATA